MKPFLSYIGSKQKFMNKLDPLFPEKINNYYEPFVGGGSVLFYLNKHYNINKNYINDIDSDVINVYKTIKNNTPKLLESLEEINKYSSKKDFNKAVESFNNLKNTKILEAALYIYLNKRSFNGNLKYDKDNLLNASYSENKKHSNIYKENNINEVKNLLKKTKITTKEYNKFLNIQNFKNDDFVFLDPPYLVDNVNQYYKNTFDYNDYEKLKEICDTLDKQHIKFMLTTNKHLKLKELFKKYNITTFKKHSSFTSGKYHEYELIITNY